MAPDDPDQHIRRTAGETSLLQMLQDGIRCRFAPTKVLWNQRDHTNDLVNIDPRRCFPTPAFSGASGTACSSS